jgi:MYXO-CTERM domain-containing protein
MPQLPGLLAQRHLRSIPPNQTKPNQTKSNQIHPMIRHLLLPTLVLGLAWATPSAQAAVVRLSWNTTVPSLGGPLSSYLARGEAWTLTLLVDNGGTTLNSQTWTAANFVGIEGLSADGDTFYSAAAPNDVSGNFQTDAAGVVIAVPARWNSFSSGPATITEAGSAPVSSTLARWYVNGVNGVLYPDSSNSWQATNVTGMRTPANWTASFAAVPEPGSAVLGLSSLAALSFRRRRR